MLSKKTISPVVASVLLLIVAVLSVVSFEIWFNTYSSSVFTSVDIKSDSNVEGGDLAIEKLIANSLYVVNNFEDNLEIKTIKLNSIPCIIEDNSLDLGINEIDLSLCLTDVSSSEVEVFLSTEKSITTKYVFVPESVSLNSICNNLQVLLHFDNRTEYGESNTNFYDFSKKSNGGVCLDSTCPVYNSSGKYGGTFDFDGANDRINLGSANILDNMSELTVCSWINQQNCDETYGIFAGKTSGDSYNGWNMYTRCAGGFGFSYWTTSGVGIWKHHSGYSITSDTWYHLCGVYRGGTNVANITIYANGIDIGSNGGTSNVNFVQNDSMHNLTLGSREPSGIYSFGGLMDEFMVWDRALNDTEILEVYNLNSSLECFR